MLTSHTPPARRPRRGVSLIEIIIAMTLLAFVLGSLGLLSAKSARRGKTLDVGSARTFVLMQQANRFSVLPYDSIPVYANPSTNPKVDTITSGRFQYRRRVAYDQSTTGSDYKVMSVVLMQLSDTTLRDSMSFVRAKTYASSPLFQDPP